MRVEIALLLLGMTAATFLPRFLPMALLSRWTLRPGIKTALGYMPVAILAAITFPALFFAADDRLSLNPQLLISALPVIVVSYFFRNLWLAVIAGMITYWLLGII